MGDRLKIVGRFGAAGSSRSLRHTMSGNGRVRTTAAVIAQHEIATEMPAARLDDPPVEELRRYIDALQCWWCGDGRVFKSLSGHWVRAHGIELQSVRDLLGVPKHQSFISDNVRDAFAARGRRLYDSERLKPAGNPRQLSEYGRKVNRRKLHDAQALTVERYEALGYTASSPEQAVQHYGSLQSAAKRSKKHPCVVCGKTIPKGKAMTCCPVCEHEQRRRKALALLAVPGEYERRMILFAKAAKIAHERNRGKRKERDCKQCGGRFKPSVLTKSKFCSPECLGQANLATRARAAATTRSNHGSPICVQDGCGESRLARGLCSRHYQQARIALLTTIRPPS